MQAESHNVTNCTTRGLLDTSEPCPAFCSFREFKEYIEEQYLQQVDATNPGKLLGGPDRIDPFIFDSKWAIDILDDVRRYSRPDQGDDDPFHFRDRTPHLWTLVQATTPQGIPGLIPFRFDHCRCESTFRCPNGTTSDPGADDIFDCRKSGQEVLLRTVPIPDSFLVNATERQVLGDLYSSGQGIGFLPLSVHETAVLTLDMRGLKANFTYNDHFQLSIYVDCEPCPPRYVCDFVPDPPACAYPNLEQQAEFGSMCSECCQCQRKSMPHWLDVNVAEFPRDDNKHDFVQVQLHALRDLKATVVLELLHGLYYGDFQRDLHGVGELYLFAPERAKYSSPADRGNRRTFLSVIEQSAFRDRTLPMNLPVQQVRVFGTPNTFVQAFESDMLIDRPADLLIGHPNYFIDRQLRINGTLPSPNVLSSQTFADAVSTGLRSGAAMSNAASHRKVGAERIAQGVGSGAFLGQASDSAAVAVPRVLQPRSGAALSRMHARGLVSQSDATDGNPVGVFLYQTVVPPGAYVPRSDRFRPQPDVVVDPGYIAEQDVTWWANSDDTPITYLFLPYLPWFSNCEGYDSHISIAKLLEDHLACVREPYESTINVDPYIWNLQLSPLSDRCYDPLWMPAPGAVGATAEPPGLPLYCYFEERIFEQNPLKRWFDLEEGEVAFQLTKEPIEPADFTANAATGEKWGRTDFLDALRGTEKIIDVIVTASPEKTLIPKMAGFTIDYYQVNKGYKRLVRSTLSLSEYCTTATQVEEVQGFTARGIPTCPPGQFNYTLEFRLRAMNWIDLLNLFEFGADVYFIAFLLIGLVTVLIGALVWALHRLLTRLRVPPLFRFWRIWNAVVPSPTFGVTLVSVPVMGVLGFVIIWFVHMGSENPIEYPTTVAFEAISGSWLDRQVLTLDRVLQYKQGRMGAALAVFGLFMVVLGARLFIPDHLGDRWTKDDAAVDDVEDDANDESDILADGVDTKGDEEQPSESWTPIEWRRFHMVLYSLAQMVLLVVMFEFAFSDTFSQNQYVFIVTFKLVQVFMELLILGIVGDALQVCPMIVTLQLTEILITMGAASFTDFIIAYFVEASLMMFERIYLDPNVKSLKAHWPLLMARLHRNSHKNKKMTREQRLTKEKEWARIVEHVKLETHGVEPLLESLIVYSNETIALLISPWLQLALLALDANPLHGLQVTEIPRGFGIRESDLLFYTIFGIVSIPAQMAMDMFLINTQELVYGWKLYEYVAYQKYRFRMRSKRWQMDDEKLDGSISSKLQTVDSMCFSSQFYSMAAFHAWGIALILLGVEIMLRKEYNLFGDVVFGFIFVAMWLLFQVLRVFLRVAGEAVSIWKLQRVEGSIDDELAAKLAIGEGDLQDLEDERIQLKSMNSERFRLRFLEKNRPWLVQHLIELLTPRTLEVPQMDGQTSSEYVRSVYKQLIAMVDDLDVGSDLSSPRELDDATPHQRRLWKSSTDPPTAKAKDVLRFWLGKARRRMMFRKVVAEIITNATRAVCDACGRGATEERTLQPLLAIDGLPRSNALEVLIRGFEKACDGDESKMSFDAWRAYFRTHAEFYMRCSECEADRRKQADRARREREFGTAARKAAADAQRRGHGRASDSDVEDTVPLFKPLTIDRKAPWGRIMAKWLRAARTRVGGEFPCPRARAEMEAYAQKLREARATRAKRVLETRRAARLGEADRVPIRRIDAQAVSAVARRLEEESDTIVDANPVSEGYKRFGVVKLSPPARAIAIRWWQASRGVRAHKDALKASRLREQLDQVLAEMHPDDLWFYTQARVDEGKAIRAQGAALLQQRHRMDESAEGRMQAARAALEAYIQDKESELVEATASMREAVAAFAAASDQRLAAKLLSIQERRARHGDESAVPDGPAPASKDEVEGQRLALDNEEFEAQRAASERVAKYKDNLMVPIDLLRRENAALAGQKREAFAREAGELRNATALQTRRLEQQWIAKAAAYIQSAKRAIRSKTVAEA